MIDTGTALKHSGQSNNINERVNYTANTGTAVISTANTNLNGTGTITTVLTTGATSGSVGSLVKQVIIKGSGSVSRGMVRLFVSNGETFTILIDETDISGVAQMEKQGAFSITYDVDWYFNAGLYIGAATNNADPFTVCIQALDIKYP